jgi:hypothetical protein
MRIDDNRLGMNAYLDRSPGPAAEDGESRSRLQGSGMGPSRDSVAVSDLASLLSQVDGGQAGTARSEMVSRIAAQYHSGKYVIDTAALGDALIAGAFEG